MLFNRGTRYIHPSVGDILKWPLAGPVNRWSSTTAFLKLRINVTCSTQSQMYPGGMNWRQTGRERGGRGRRRGRENDGE